MQKSDNNIKKVEAKHSLVPNDDFYLFAGKDGTPATIPDYETYFKIAVDNDLLLKCYFSPFLNILK